MEANNSFQCQVPPIFALVRRGKVGKSIHPCRESAGSLICTTVPVQVLGQTRYSVSCLYVKIEGALDDLHGLYQ
jgi:hypothetical protein